MIGFQNIKKINIPFSCIEKVYEHLRKVGNRGVEGVALFAGEFKESTFYVKTEIIPKQEAFNHHGGLLYTVDGEELHKINVWLYKNKMTLIAQIHSHPGLAYHSDTDDKYPIITTIGGVSIVIPDFGFNPISISDWAVYRLNSSSGWVKHIDTDVKTLISII